MKTETELFENERPRPKYNVVLGIYTVVTTFFVAGYTMVKILTFA